MAYRMMKSGLIGVALGMGFGQGGNREAGFGLDRSTTAAERACHQRSMESAPDIYDIRTLGRSEARLTGVKITGGSERLLGLASEEARLAAGSIYQLRTLGRAEAKQTEPILAGGSLEGPDQMILAAGDSDMSIYRLRTKGRAEARGIGVDYCEIEGILPERLGLR